MTSPSHPEFTLRNSAAVRWLWLIGPTLVLVLSFLLQPGEGREVLFPFSRIALPESCYTYVFFGFDCPGCGLTRSFVHLARGQWKTAWQLNPLAIVLYTYVILQIPQAGLRWIPVSIRNRWLSERTLARWTRINEWMAVGILIGLAAQWIIRLILKESI